MMKKVFITGIDSFTGKHLSKYLKEKKYDVYGTSYLKSQQNIFKCDITNKKSIMDTFSTITPDFMVHLAGIAYVGHNNHEDFYKINTIGTQNILETMLSLNIKPEKIILPSSATVYGDQESNVLNESMCPKPKNHYGMSKYAMECLVENYFNKLPIIITRPFNYTGIGQTNNFLIPKIVNHFKENKKTIELGNIHVSREFNDVKFVCESYEKLFHTKHDSLVVNIATNKSIALLDVINYMNKIAGYEINIKINENFVRKNEIPKLTGSDKKLINLIGKTKQQNIVSTLREMFEA